VTHSGQSPGTATSVIPPDANLVGLFYAERNREFPLRSRVVPVGRGPENAIRIPDPRIAGRHARFLRDDRGFAIEAVDENAVTTLNGDCLAPGERRDLSHGDVVSLSGLGFRFVLNEDAPVLAWLHVVVGVHKGKRFRIIDPRIQVGRGADEDIQFPDRTVSRRHCRVFRRDGRWWIEDLGSRNGTIVNGRPVTEPTALEDGDMVWLGDSGFRFRLDAYMGPIPSA